MTGARGLKIANIDKLYIFDMQLFMFLYRGIFFDAALLGVLHCYIVTLLHCYIVTLLHCYVCVFPLRLLYSRIRIVCKVYSEQ